MPRLVRPAEASYVALFFGSAPFGISSKSLALLGFVVTLLSFTFVLSLLFVTRRLSSFLGAAAASAACGLFSSFPIAAAVAVIPVRVAPAPATSLAICFLVLIGATFEVLLDFPAFLGATLVVVLSLADFVTLVVVLSFGLPPISLRVPSANC